MIKKTFKNSPKGRSEIPNRSGSYILLDKRGKKIYEGITNNLKERIKEHHYDKSKVFSYIKIIRDKRNKLDSPKITKGGYIDSGFELYSWGKNYKIGSE